MEETATGQLCDSHIKLGQSWCQAPPSQMEAKSFMRSRGSGVSGLGASSESNAEVNPKYQAAAAAAQALRGVAGWKKDQHKQREPSTQVLTLPPPL